MWNIVRQMERRYRALRQNVGRLGVTGAFGVGALFVILIAGWLVDRHAATAADRRLAQLARSAGEQPLEAIVRAARANRLLFLSDIHNAAATKELAAEAVARIATTSGLDAIIVEVGADQQPFIDQYLDRTPEDASVLLSNPRTIGEPGAATRAYLDIYRAVWRINQKLGADERIRIIAADLPGWPPATPSPTQTARIMAVRDAYMEKTVQEQVLSSIPDARILFFLSGLHNLKSASVLVQTAGTAPVTVAPLAARFAASSSEVYTILVDAASAGVTGQQLVAYNGTTVAQVLADGGVHRSCALPLTTAFDYLKAPVVETKTPGIEYSIEPRDYKLRDVADTYIYLGR